MGFNNWIIDIFIFFIDLCFIAIVIVFLYLIMQTKKMANYIKEKQHFESIPSIRIKYFFNETDCDDEVVNKIKKAFRKASVLLKKLTIAFIFLFLFMFSIIIILKT